MLAEEPRLRRDFGESYYRYCQKVRNVIDNKTAEEVVNDILEELKKKRK